MRDEVLDGSTDVTIAFDRPDEEWASKQNAPTINLYLYDVSENLVRREVVYEEIRNDDGRVIERRPPPRRFDLAYLVSAWTQRVEDEHRLLNTLLECLLAHETMPPGHLAASLADQPLPIRIVAGRPRPETRKAPDVWSAVGGPLKPSVDLLVTAPFVTDRTGHVGPPVIEVPRFDFGDDEVGGGTRAGRRAPDEGAEPDLATERVHGGRAEESDDDPAGRRLGMQELPRP